MKVVIKFTLTQLAAIYRLGSLMACVDKIDSEHKEVQVVIDELKSFGVSRINLDKIIELSKEMSNDYSRAAYDIVDAMNVDQKKYVYSFLLGIIAADRNVSDEESELLSKIIDRCHLPVVLPKVAAKYLA